MSLSMPLTTNHQTLSPNFTPNIPLRVYAFSSTTHPIGGKSAWGCVLVNKTAIQKIISLHDWESANLPLFRHSIGQSVVLRLLEAFVQGKSLSVKELTLSLPHSPSGVRLQLRMLENDGWIEFLPNPEDQRVKVIQPSSGFNRALETYAYQCLELLGGT